MRKIVVSLLAMILFVSAFVTVKGNSVKRQAQTADNTPPEHSSEGTVQSTFTNSIDAGVLQTSSSYSSEIGGLEPLSTNGPKIEKLRFIATSPPPPDEVLYIDGFTGHYTDWTLVGASPYIDAVDYPTNYIEESDYGGLGGYVGRFSFQNTTLSTISWGRIEAFAQSDWSEVEADLYIRHGNTAPTIWAGSIRAGAAWSWVPTAYVTEIPPDFLTPAEINSLTLRMIRYYTPDGSEGQAIRIDAIRLSLWKAPWPPSSAPTAKVKAMKDGQLDVGTDLLTTAEIEALGESCFTITQDLEFHIFHMGFNIRSDQSYRLDKPSEELAYVAAVLSDVNFRHALIHCYDQLGIIPPIYGYTVAPTRSLVPYAQSKYYNPAVMTHPYNPGNPFTSSPGDGSSCGILMAAGYTFVDADSSGTVTEADYWTKAGFAGAPLPTLRMFTPTVRAAPTSYQHGAEIINDLVAIGLGNIEQAPEDFNTYRNKVFQNAEFDMYLMGWSLGRLPDHLYNMLHSSQDCHLYLGGGNAPGVNDATIDTLVEDVMFSLDTDTIEVAAEEVQGLLYDPSNNYAFAYMQLYSKSAFNAFNCGIRGIVKSPGFGSNNMWTFLNMHWKTGHPFERIEDGKSTIVWGIADGPQSLNPTYASSASAWMILDRTYDGLTAVNPYNHNDIPWVAPDWSITETVDGMNIDFTLRSDVEWQDGKPVTAYDIEWCLEFIRDRQIPRYYYSCAHIIDVSVTDNTHFTIQCDEASLSLFYSFSDLGVLLPRHIWDRPWANNQEVLIYDPTEPYNVASGYTPGPTPPPTNLFGTGPFIFQFYDATNQYSDLWGNPSYFLPEAEIQSVMTSMFWEVGDVDRDGVVEQDDIDRVGAAYGSHPGDPNWDPDCDFDRNNFIEVKDARIVADHLSWRLGYPAETIDVAVLDVTAFPTVVYPGQEINISVVAKSKGNIGFASANLTYYYDSTFIGYQIVTNLIPCHNRNVNYIWDTTSVSPGIYTVSVNATALDGADANTADNTFVNGKVKIGTTKIAVAPQKSIVGSAGKDFSINVTITDAPYNATWAWEFKLSWNATLLNITDVSEGAFLSQSGTWETVFANLTDREEGWVLVSCTLIDDPILHGQPLPYGNETLATISFTALNLGNCTLHLSDTVLLNYYIDAYFHTTQDGEFEVLLGDVDRNGVVNAEDIRLIKLAYGSVPGSPNWNPEADIWGPDDQPDGIVSVYDLGMCGKKYAETG